MERAVQSRLALNSQSFKPSYENKVKMRLEKCTNEKYATRVWVESYCLSRKPENCIFVLLKVAVQKS
jgi:hypothetical protein